MRKARPVCGKRKCVYQERTDGCLVCIKCFHHKPKDKLPKKRKEKIEPMVAVPIKLPVWFVEKVKARAKQQGVPYTTLMRHRVMSLRGKGKPKPGEYVK